MIDVPRVKKHELATGCLAAIKDGVANQPLAEGLKGLFAMDGGALFRKRLSDLISQINRRTASSPLKTLLGEAQKSMDARNADRFGYILLRMETFDTSLRGGLMALLTELYPAPAEKPPSSTEVAVQVNMVAEVSSPPRESEADSDFEIGSQGSAETDDSEFEIRALSPEELEELKKHRQTGKRRQARDFNDFVLEELTKPSQSST
jgi:hypothetical protein